MIIAMPVLKDKPLGMQISSAVSMALLAIVWSGSAFPADEAAAPAESPVPQPQLQFAPVQLRPSLNGNVYYLIRRDTYGQGRTTTQSLNAAVNAAVDVNSFIWQPWFAQVSGRAGVSTYMTDTSYTAAGAQSGNKTVSNTVNGRMGLNVVPLSRFPFSAFVEKTDNRQNVGFASASTSSQSTRLGLSQNYSTLSGQTSYSAAYNLLRSEREFFGEDRQKQLALGMRTTISPNQSLSINGNRNFNQHVGSPESTLYNNLYANHSYRPSASVNVENLATLGKSTYHLVTGDTEFNTRQLNNITSWTSDERPLTVTGSVRLYSTENISPANYSKQSQASATLGTSYNLTQQLRAYANAGVNVNEDSVSGRQYVSSNESAALAYNSRPMPLGSFSYSTNASAGITNANGPSGSGTVANSRQGANLGAGHSLSRSSSDASGRVRFDTGVAQSASVSKVELTPASTRLMHSGSLGWTIAGDTGTTQLRLNASDSRSTSAPRDFFQLANLQANRSQNMTRNASLSGNLTIQATRQGDADTPAPTTVTSNASLSYAHQRLFGVPRLAFNSEARIYGDRSPLKIGPVRHETRSWNNSLNYSIGRLVMAAQANAAQTIIGQGDPFTQTTLLFTLSRAF